MKRTYILFAALALFVSSFAFKGQSSELKASMERGKGVYDGSGLCTVCHMPEGTGMTGAFPPLAKSDYLMADLDRSIKIVIEGLTGEIEVSGKKYNGAMQPSGLDNKDIADVLNYVRNSWGNKGDKMVTEAMVAKVRAGK